MKLTKKKIVGIVVAVVIVLAIIAGLVYSKTDLFKSPKDLFYKYIGKSTEVLGDLDYDKSLENYKTLNKKTYSATGDMTFEIEGDDYELEQISDVVKDIKINYEQKAIPSQEKMYSKMVVNYQNKDLTNVELLSGDNKIGIKCEDIYDKYLSIENKNLKELAEKFGLSSENVPDQINKVDIYDILYISKEDRNKILEKYWNIIDNDIAKEKYTSQKNVEISYDGQNVKANSYTLTLTEKELQDITVKLLETFRDDDFTLDLIIDKVNKLNVNSVMEESLTKEDIKDGVQNLIDELKDTTAYDDETVKIVVYSYNDKTVKIEFVNEDDSIVIDLVNKDNNNIITVKVLYAGEEESVVTINYTIEKKNEEEKLNGYMKVENDGEEAQADFEVQTKGKIGTGINETTMKLSIGNDEFKIKFNLNQKVDFSEDVTIESFDANNSVNINEADEQELTKVVTEIQNNVMTVLPEKLEILGIDPSDL